MKKLSLLAVVLLAPIVGVVLAQPADRRNAPPAEQAASPLPPAPGEHHKWLEQLVGTWSVESVMSGEGMPAVKSTGTDTVRSLGGRWVLCELNCEIAGMGKMNAVLTLGYNPATGKYQGTWVDSVTDHLWTYEGTLDATGKVLTLEAEGPNMMDPAKGKTLYRDVIELKTPDHRTLSSSAMVDGKWVQFGTGNYRRMK